MATDQRTKWTVGQLVRARRRDWVVLPPDEPGVVRIGLSTAPTVTVDNRGLRSRMVLPGANARMTRRRRWPLLAPVLAAYSSARRVQEKQLWGRKGHSGPIQLQKQVDFGGYRPLSVNTLLKGPSPVKERPNVQKGATPYRTQKAASATRERDCCRGSVGASSQRRCPGVGLLPEVLIRAAFDDCRRTTGFLRALRPHG